MKSIALLILAVSLVACTTTTTTVTDPDGRVTKTVVRSPDGKTFYAVSRFGAEVISASVAAEMNRRAEEENRR